jgi:hypothetical protein
MVFAWCILVTQTAVASCAMTGCACGHIVSHVVVLVDNTIHSGDGPAQRMACCEPPMLLRFGAWHCLPHCCFPACCLPYWTGSVERLSGGVVVLLLLMCVLSGITQAT